MHGADTLLVLPELVVLVGAVATLLLGSFLPRQRQWTARLLAVAVLAGAVVVSVVAPRVGAGAEGPTTAFSGTFAVDGATTVVRVVLCLSTLLVVGLGVDELAGVPRESDTYALLLLGTLGGLVLASATDLLVLAVAFLLSSVPLYGLIGLAGTSRAAEAVLKAYLLGALLGIVMLLGVGLLYAGTAGTTYAELAERLPASPAALAGAGLVAVLVGLLFEAGAVPAHFWVPDAAQGASTTAAAFLTTVPKVAALLAAYRFLEAATAGGTDPGLTRTALVVVGVVAVASMTLGNLAAFWQDDVRRLLGWSTVSQVGYVLLPVAVVGAELALASLLVYLAGYAVTNLTAFAVVAAHRDARSIADWAGLARRYPVTGVALVVALLGLVGTPPTAVFVGKLATFGAAWDAGAGWLAVVAVLNTVASLFYYLRWLAPAFRAVADAPGGDDPRRPLAWASRAAAAGSVGVLVVGLAAGVVVAAGGGAPVR